MLNVKRNSYYKWLKIGKPIMNNYSKFISEIVLVEHLEMKRIYGTFRLKHLIEAKYKGIIINHKRIRRYKKSLNLSVVVRRGRSIYVKAAQEKNLANKASYVINCDFKSKKPLQKLSSDVSYIKCTDGTLYLSAIKDLFNNEIVSFSTSCSNDISLIKDSYKDLKSSDFTGSLINTDQGSVYLANEYLKLMTELGYTRSMSHRGHCWENCPIENWFSQLKEEWLRPIGKISKEEAAKEIKKYIKWYNTQRIQKKLGYLSPCQFKFNYQN